MFRISKLLFLPFSGFRGMVRSGYQGLTPVDNLALLACVLVLPVAVLLGMVSGARILKGVAIDVAGDGVLPYYDYKGVVSVLLVTFVMSHVFLKGSWQRAFPHAHALDVAVVAGFYCSIWQAAVLVGGVYCGLLWFVTPALLRKYVAASLPYADYHYYVALVAGGLIAAVIISYLRTKLFVSWFAKEVGRDYLRSVRG